MSLFIPLAVIPEPPEHQIVAILIRDSSRIFTGALNGQCVLWKRPQPPAELEAESHSSLDQFAPVALVDGHCCAVCTLLPCTFEWTPAIASSHEDGTLSLFDPDDGRCLLRQSDLLPGKSTAAAVLPDQRRLVYCGHFCGLVMVDCYNLEVQAHFGCDQGWHLSVHAFIGPTASMLATVTKMGQLLVWTADEGEPHQIVTPAPLSSCCRGRLVCTAATRSGTLMLLVSRKRASVVIVDNAQEISSVEIEDEGASWCDGYFTHEHRFVLCSSTYGGEAKIMGFSIEHHDSEKASKTKGCVLHARLSQNVAEPRSVHGSHLHQATISCANGIVAYAMSPGKLTLWPTNHLFRDDIRPQEFDSVHYVSDGWDDPGSSRVTASCILALEQGLPRLVQGFENGSLALSIMPSDKPFIMEGAHPGAITHLYVPILGVQGNSLVCSCSTDGTIHIWMVSRIPDFDGLPVQKMLTCSYHSSTISMLSQPTLCPDTASETSQTVLVPFIVFATYDRMLGVVTLPEHQTDGTVTPVLLGPHPAQISATAWHASSSRLYVVSGNTIHVWLLMARQGQQPSSAALESCMDIWDSGLCGQLHTALSTVLRTTPGSIAANMTDTALDEGLSLSCMRWLQLQPVRMGDVMGRNMSGCAMIIGIKRLAAELHLMLKGKQHQESNSATLNMSTEASSFAFMAISYLVIWGHDQASDELKRRVSALLPPTPPFLHGMRGHCGIVTYLTPRAIGDQGSGRWQFSPYMTSVHALSLVSIARLLLSLGCDNQMCVDLITQACVLLPETVENYIPPSLSLLARYWEDTWEDLQDAARSLLTAAINRMCPEERSACVSTWQLRMTTTDLGVPKGVAVIILGIMACLFPASLETALTAQVAAALLTNVHQQVPQSALAADILSRGFVTFKKHVDDVHGLIHILFQYSAEGDPKRPSFGERVRCALVLISAAVPQPFLEVMSQIGSNPDMLMAHKVLTIQLLKSVITKFTVHFETHIPVVVEYLMALLNPGIPARRERCLRACTVVLRTMCQKYQFISFHQESQKYAVGTAGGTVVVYDLRTATKWRILQGQVGPILAVAFDPQGSKISSFSATASTLCVWQAGSYGMFEMFGLTGSCISEAKTPHISCNSNHLPSLVWDTSGTAVCLLQNGNRVLTHRC